jgi:hypothetical protein
VVHLAGVIDHPGIAGVDARHVGVELADVGPERVGTSNDVKQIKQNDNRNWNTDQP